jgi:hypothetical protein
MILSGLFVQKYKFFFFDDAGSIFFRNFAEWLLVASRKIQVARLGYCASTSATAHNLKSEI